MPKLTNYIQYSEEPNYHLFLSKQNKSFVVFKFSIKYIYKELKVPSVYLKFKYKNLPIILSTSETYICD